MYKLKHGTVTNQLIPRNEIKHTDQSIIYKNESLITITYSFQCPPATFGCLNMLEFFLQLVVLSQQVFLLYFYCLLCQT